MRRNVWVAGLAVAAIASGIAFAHPGGPWGQGEGGYGPVHGYGCAMHTGGGMGMMGHGYGMRGGWGPGGGTPEGLDLTAEQREKLAAARADTAKKMDGLRKEARDRIEAILTPEQRAKLGSCGPW